MCQGRLAAGEAPACAQACPTEAISIIKVSVSIEGAAISTTAIESHAALTALSGTDSAYTLPSTRYISKTPLPAGLFAADTHTLRPQHAHYALVFLLVLTQLGVGLLLSS
jgi:hypothetical protein